MGAPAGVRLAGAFVQRSNRFLTGLEPTPGIRAASIRCRPGHRCPRGDALGLFSEVRRSDTGGLARPATHAVGGARFGSTPWWSSTIATAVKARQVVASGCEARTLAVAARRRLFGPGLPRPPGPGLHSPACPRSSRPSAPTRGPSDGACLHDRPRRKRRRRGCRAARRCQPGHRGRRPRLPSRAFR